MLRNIEPRPLWGCKKGRGEARQLSTANSSSGIGGITTDVLQYEVMFDKVHGHFIQSSTRC